MKLMIILLMTTFGWSELIFACTQPTQSQLRSFFKSQNNWSRVRNNTNQRIGNNSVEVRINFQRPLDSKILHRGESLGQVDRVCKINDSTISILAQGHTIRVVRNGDRIQTRIGLFTYQFLPKGQWIDAMEQDLYYGDDDIQYAEGPTHTSASL